MSWSERNVDRNLESIRDLLSEEFDHSTKISRSGVYRHDRFLRPTNLRIGQTPISSAVVCQSELDEQNLKISVGVHANASWERLMQHNHIKTWNELSKVVHTYSQYGLFGQWASIMQREYQNGLQFAERLAPAFTSRFLGFNTPINQYDSSKELLFPNTNIMRAAVFKIEKNDFEISLAKMDVVEEGQNDLVGDIIEVDGKRYSIHDFAAVWLPTLTGNTWHPENDLSAKMELASESFNVLEDRLRKLEELNRPA